MFATPDCRNLTAAAMFSFLIPILQANTGALVGVVFTALGAAIVRLIERAKLKKAFEVEKAELIARN
jgi:hypothetical protein